MLVHREFQVHIFSVSQLNMSDKNAKTIQWGTKKAFFNKHCCNNWISLGNKNKLNHYYTHKNNLRWIVNLNLKEKLGIL